MRAEREFGKASYSCCLRVTPFEAATIKFYETMRRAALAVNGTALGLLAFSMEEPKPRPHRTPHR